MDNLLFILFISNSFSIKSICSYFIPYSFKELLLLPVIPITVWRVSYGSPDILIIVSPDFNNADKEIDNACVPEINWLLTIASSDLKISLYISSNLFLPGSSIPYPVDEFKWDSRKSHFWNAFKTFLLLNSHILFILSKIGLISFSVSLIRFSRFIFIITSPDFMISTILYHLYNKKSNS